jgi:hypothetical protein
MQRCSRFGTAGQDEPGERRHFLLETIDQLFETIDISIGNERFGHALRKLVGRIRQLGADGEQITLDMDERVVEIRAETFSTNQSEPGIQLVDVAVRFHARIGFADAGVVEQSGLTGIAGARIDFHES